MDTAINTIIAIAWLINIAWMGALGVGILGWFTWCIFIEPARDAWLCLKPVPPTAPMVDLREHV